MKNLFFALVIIASISSCTKDAPANQRFLGTYNGTINYGSGSSQTSQQITAQSGNPSGIILVSSTDNLNATVSGNNFTVPFQSFSDGSSWTGSGYLSGNNITIYLNYTDINGNALSGTFSGTK